MVAVDKVNVTLKRDKALKGDTQRKNPELFYAIIESVFVWMDRKDREECNVKSDEARSVMSRVMKR